MRAILVGAGATQQNLTRLGVHLRELDEWNCCGASSAQAVSEPLAISLSARNLGINEKTGLDLVVPCASCYQRLKRAEKDYGLTYCTFEVNFGGLPHKEAMKSLEKFAKYVMPHFK